MESKIIIELSTEKTAKNSIAILPILIVEANSEPKAFSIAIGWIKWIATLTFTK